jgi:hypothetical protein
MVLIDIRVPISLQNQTTDSRKRWASSPKVMLFPFVQKLLDAGEGRIVLVKKKF